MIFSPNYYNTPRLCTTSTIFKLYATQTVSISPISKIQKNHKQFQNPYINQTVSKIKQTIPVPPPPPTPSYPKSQKVVLNFCE